MIKPLVAKTAKTNAGKLAHENKELLAQAFDDATAGRIIAGASKWLRRKHNDAEWAKTPKDSGKYQEGLPVWRLDINRMFRIFRSGADRGYYKLIDHKDNSLVSETYEKIIMSQMGMHFYKIIEKELFPKKPKKPKTDQA